MTVLTNGRYDGGAVKEYLRRARREAAALREEEAAAAAVRGPVGSGLKPGEGRDLNNPGGGSSKGG